MSLFSSLSVGLSALQAGQTALQVVGQNLANANTAGYQVQTPNYVSTDYGSKIGTGVDIASISQATDAPVQAAILQANGQQNATSAQLSVAQQIQTVLTAGGSTAGADDAAGTNNSSIGSTLTSFFDQLTELTSTTTNNTATASTVIGQATTLASEFNSAASGLGQLRSNIGTQVGQTVASVNDLTSQLATLNTQISGVESQGGNANSLIDQQNQLLNQLSQQVDIQVVSQPHGMVNVLSSGGPLVVGDNAISYQAATNATGTISVTQTKSGQAANFTGGTLGGQLQAYNQTIPAVNTQLDTLANTLSASVNQIQATGLGSAGPLTSTQGTVSVASPTAALSTQTLGGPIQAGQLVISVTNTATGTRTNDTVAIDPSTQSLQDVATAITSATGGQVQATVNSTTNTLQLSAQSGYGFDFAGRDTIPASGGAVSNPDTSGVLSALGINGLFSGSGAAGITVNSAVGSTPGLLATSKTGEPGDSSNLAALANLQTQSLVSGQTLSQQFTTIATGVGTSVQQMTDQQTAQSGLVQNLTNQDQSVTGVDQNQELVNMVSAQQLISSASQYMEAVNSVMNSLLQILQPGA
jgi:flagellar hook-associated protein FlgK